MLHLSLEEGVFHTPSLPNSQVINQKYHSNVVLFNLIIKDLSYIPYSGCVFEHILNTSVLTNNEKLFYLVADGLSLINGKKDTQHRSVALSSIQWAEKLNCSKTEIFSLQKSLEEKDYFVIIRDTNKFGKNQRNIIIPTLPDQVFQQLYTAADRYNLDPKDKQRIPSATYFPTLTSISNSSNTPYIQTNKRTYLDKTKLFFRINYQILSSVIASSELSAFTKIVWLNFYSKCYKNYIKAKQFNNDQHVNDYFAFTASYQELETQFACSRYTLSKSLNKLEDLCFIVKNRFFVKNTNANDNLHDKSLWNITVSLPQEYLLKTPNINPKSTKKFENNVAKYDPYCADSGQLLIKGFKLNNNDIKNLDDIDANSLKNSKNLDKDFQSLSELSVSYKNFIQKKEEHHQVLCQTETTNVELSTNPGVEKNKIIKDEVLAITVDQTADLQTEEKKEILTVNAKTTIDSNKNINDRTKRPTITERAKSEI